MRKVMLSAIMAAASSLTVGAKTPVAGARVVVYLKTGSFPESGSRLMVAQGQATWLFKEAGIHLEWRSGAPQEDPNADRVVGIAFIPKAPPFFQRPGHELALAAAQPYTEGLTSIQIFTDRVLNLLEPFNEHESGRLLGHIFAHELAHVIEGIARHSEAGLMKPLWVHADYPIMVRGGGLLFTAHDVDLLREGLWRTKVARAGAGAGN